MQRNRIHEIHQDALGLEAYAYVTFWGNRNNGDIRLDLCF